MFPAAAAAKSLQSCPNLCYPIDGSARGSPVPGILQARTYVHLCCILDSAYKWYRMVLVFLSDLLHLVWSSLDLTMLLQMALFVLFNGWLIFYWLNTQHLLCPFICWCTFSCFHVLAVMTSAAMNIGVHISFLNYSFVCICAQEWDYWSYGNSIFSKTHTFKTSLQLKFWQRIKLLPSDILDTLCKIWMGEMRPGQFSWEVG